MDVTEHPAVIAVLAAIDDLQADIAAGTVPELDGTARLAAIVTDMCCRIMEDGDPGLALYLSRYSRHLARHAADLIRQADLEAMSQLEVPSDASGLDA